MVKRIEFLFRGNSYKFILNPEEYSQMEPNRVMVTQTKAGAFIDDFGAGVPIITFKGTTGFKGTGTDITKGFSKFKELRDYIRSYYDKLPPGSIVGPEDEMTFFNYTDEEYWIVTPKVFSLKRSVARPLMYLYDIELICQRKAGVPHPDSLDTPQEGMAPVISIDSAIGSPGNTVPGGIPTILPSPTVIKNPTVSNVPTSMRPVVPPGSPNGSGGGGPLSLPLVEVR